MQNKTIKFYNLCRELSIQVDCGVVDLQPVMNGVAKCDERNGVEAISDDNKRGTPHSCNEASDPGASSIEENGAAQRTDTAVENHIHEQQHLECQLR